MIVCEKVTRRKGKKSNINLEIVALFSEKVQFVFQFLQHQPLQESFSLVKGPQTMCLPGDPHTQRRTPLM